MPIPTRADWQVLKALGSEKNVELGWVTFSKGKVNGLILWVIVWTAPARIPFVQCGRSWDFVEFGVGGNGQQQDVWTEL
jgi:hypothetical protein